jgi:hypothetical protein
MKMIGRSEKIRNSRSNCQVVIKDVDPFLNACGVGGILTSTDGCPEHR